MSQAEPRRLSVLLRTLLASDRARWPTVGEFLDGLADDGFAVVLGALALPALIPIFPPGTAVLIGVVFALVGIQMVIGGRSLWVPERWRRRPLPSGFANILLARGVPLAERLERLHPPQVHATGWLIRLSGTVPLVMGLIMIAPLPGLNTVPAFLVLVLAIGLLRDDAIFIAASVAASVALLAAMGVAIRFLVAEMERVIGWVLALVERLR